MAQFFSEFPGHDDSNMFDFSRDVIFKEVQSLIQAWLLRLHGRVHRCSDYKLNHIFLLIPSKIDVLLIALFIY